MRWALILASLLVAPAMAQSANCNAQWQAIGDFLSEKTGQVLPPLGLVREQVDGGCRVNGLSFPAGPSLTLKVEGLSWSGRDMERFVSEGLPPTALTVELSGISFLPEVGEPEFQYLFEVQSRGRRLSASLDIEWDADTKVLEIKSARVSFPEGDFVSYQASVENVDLTDKASLQMSAGRFGVTSAALTVRSTRLFQDYVLLPLGQPLLQGHPDPEARVAELKQEAYEVFGDVPESVLPNASKNALRRLVADLPDPSGVLQITQTANPGLGVARGMMIAARTEGFKELDDLWSLFDGVEIEVTYEPL